MKEVEKVSISGIAFMMDRDAFGALNTYVESLHTAYDKEPDGAEIVADIEARIAEIILSRQNTGTVVSLPLVEEIVARLGAPEAPECDAPAHDSPPQTFPRRLYRNPEGAKLGGVCSGLATFLNTDAVWVRLIIFLPVFLLIITAPFHLGSLHSLLGKAFGTIALWYVILWIVVPMARTPRQKLEMRGQKITASSIGQGMQRDLTARGASLRSRQAASVWAEIMLVLGRIALFCVKAVALIVAFCTGIVAVAMAVGIGMAIMASDKMVVWHHPMSELLAGMEGISPEGYAVVTLLVAFIPVVMITILLFRLIFGRGMGQRTFTIIGGIWLIITVYWGINTVRNYTLLRDGITYRIERIDELQLSGTSTATFGITGASTE